jgi:hypothetical protein
MVVDELHQEPDVVEAYLDGREGDSVACDTANAALRSFIRSERPLCVLRRVAFDHLDSACHVDIADASDRVDLKDVGWICGREWLQ